MSEHDPNYLKALENSDIVWSPALGLAKEGTTVSQSILAKQNNLIIELLVSLHHRVTRIEEQLAQKTSSKLEEEIGEISAKLANLKVGEKDPNRVQKGTGVIAVWKDPRQQVEDFKKKYGST